MFAGDLLVGNFGNGMINAYNPTTGAFVGTIDGADGNALVIDGLWGLTVGNGSATGGSLDTLFSPPGPTAKVMACSGCWRSPSHRPGRCCWWSHRRSSASPPYGRTKTPIDISASPDWRLQGSLQRLLARWSLFDRHCQSRAVKTLNRERQPSRTRDADAISMTGRRHSRRRLGWRRGS